MVNLATPSKLLAILSVLTITSCTSLKQDIVNSDTPVASFSAQNQIDQTDNEIDQMVYELYGLTEDEIKIVEES